MTKEGGFCASLIVTNQLYYSFFMEDIILNMMHEDCMSDYEFWLEVSQWMM